MNSFGNSNGLASGFGTTGALGGGGTGLASNAAVMGFAHGAAIQQQQAREAQRNRNNAATGGKQVPKNRIREVWQNNLGQEMQNLRELVEKYPYISMVRHR